MYNYFIKMCDSPPVSVWMVAKVGPKSLLRTLPRKSRHKQVVCIVFHVVIALRMSSNPYHLAIIPPEEPEGEVHCEAVTVQDIKSQEI